MEVSCVMKQHLEMPSNNPLKIAALIRHISAAMTESGLQSTRPVELRGAETEETSESDRETVEAEEPSSKIEVRSDGDVLGSFEFWDG